MPFCTGQGTDDVGGCCHLGERGICPHYHNGNEVQDWITAQGWKGQQLTRARNQAQGVKHACDIAIQVVVADARTLTDRALFEQRWHDHPDYQADVRPAWVELEQTMGYPVESYNCPTWQGGAGTHEIEHTSADNPKSCCWAQTDATCDEQAYALHVTAVTLRRAGGV